MRRENGFRPLSQEATTRLEREAAPGLGTHRAVQPLPSVAQLLANIVGTCAGVCGMIGFVPQIAKIIKEKDASSVSLKMYAVTTTGFVLWTAYGFILQSWPIAVSN